MEMVLSILGILLVVATALYFSRKAKDRRDSRSDKTAEVKNKDLEKLLAAGYSLEEANKILFEKYFGKPG